MNDEVMLLQYEHDEDINTRYIPPRLYCTVNSCIEFVFCPAGRALRI